MQIPTNQLGLLLAEVDSAGSLRLSGDRVLFGARRSQSETEWLVRQKVAQCRQGIADVVHSFGGVVVQILGDRVLCNLVDAERAMEAACMIQQTIAPRTSSDEDSQSVTMQMGVRIALHFDKVYVDAGRLSGPSISLIEALIGEVESEQILATESFVGRLSPRRRSLAKAMAPVSLVKDAGPTGLMEIDWRRAGELRGKSPPEPESASDTTDRLMAPGSDAPEADVEPPDAIDPDVTQTTDLSQLNEPGLMQKLHSRPDALTSGPRMELTYKGKQIVLDASRRTITLRRGPERAQHARITLSDGIFALENLDDLGTGLRDADGDVSICTGETIISGRGSISLGQSFDEGSQVIEYQVNA